MNCEDYVLNVLNETKEEKEKTEKENQKLKTEIENLKKKLNENCDFKIIERDSKFYTSRYWSNTMFSEVLESINQKVSYLKKVLKNEKEFERFINTKLYGLKVAEVKEMNCDFIFEIMKGDNKFKYAVILDEHKFYELDNKRLPYCSTKKLATEKLYKQVKVEITSYIVNKK